MSRISKISKKSVNSPISNNYRKENLTRFSEFNSNNLDVFLNFDNSSPMAKQIIKPTSAI